MNAGWTRSPALHFALIGALLFAASQVWGGRESAPNGASPRPPIVISAAQIARMRANFESRYGAAPTAAQLDGMIQQAVDDELLYREARRVGLAANDHSVRLRMVQKMRALGADPTQDDDALYRQALDLGLDDDIVVRAILRHKMLLLLMRADPNRAPITNADVAAYLDSHREDFVQPPTITFSHVFLSATVHGVRLETDARQLLARLRAQAVVPAAAVAMSDPFPLGPDLYGQNQERLTRLFGAQFAANVFKMPQRTWSGPIASAFGTHLVWISQVTAERMPPLDAVRRQAANSIEEERAEERFAAAMDRLRAMYEVRVESSRAARDDDAMLSRADRQSNRGSR
jgi:hypothetical protein